MPSHRITTHLCLPSTRCERVISTHLIVIIDPPISGYLVILVAFIAFKAIVIHCHQSSTHYPCAFKVVIIDARHTPILLF